MSPVYFVLGILKMDVWNQVLAGPSPTNLIFYSMLLPYSLTEKVLFHTGPNKFVLILHTYLQTLHS